MAMTASKGAVEADDGDDVGCEFPTGAVRSAKDMEERRSVADIAPLEEAVEDWI